MIRSVVSHFRISSDRPANHRYTVTTDRMRRRRRPPGPAGHPGQRVRDRGRGGVVRPRRRADAVGTLDRRPLRRHAGHPARNPRRPAARGRGCDAGDLRRRDRVALAPRDGHRPRGTRPHDRGSQLRRRRHDLPSRGRYRYRPLWGDRDRQGPRIEYGGAPRGRPRVRPLVPMFRPHSTACDESPRPARGRCATYLRSLRSRVAMLTVRIEASLRSASHRSLR